MTYSNPDNQFSIYRRNIIGHQQTFETAYGMQRIRYADWTASGRAYMPIEQYMLEEILPFVGNTHTETTITGSRMSRAYEEARQIVKTHCNASDNDVLVFCGSGMTAAVNKLQRILTPGYVVFVTHMEHHSNYLCWLESAVQVEIINRDQNGNVDLTHFSQLLEKYKHHPHKIAAVTACSNVTGIETPYYEIAKMIHQAGGLCFVDFACSAPYVTIDMHPDDNYLDAIYFSPHKFLGGPGTPGVLIFNKHLYKRAVPDHPGGGTVTYTNPWGGRDYIPDIEQREDGGTPPFLQAIKAGRCILLKEEMGVANILKREKELLAIIFSRLSRIQHVQILEADVTERLGIVSFIVTGMHYNEVVRLLNDRFGIQLRGGCSCAGTYGHILLGVDEPQSYHIRGDLSRKPGWVRLSVHPTMTDADIHFIMDALETIIGECENA